MNNKIYLVVIGLLAIACAYLGYNLGKTNDVVDTQTETIGELGLEREGLTLELEKMKFSYDTLQTENSLMMAEMAAQKMEIEALLGKVKDKNWSISKLQKETNTLRDIMKGYVFTIDSLNQLNQQLLAENAEMQDRVSNVEGQNRDLLERQENMEGLIASGQVLQTTRVEAQSYRLKNSGSQTETTRASKTELIKTCFEIVKNDIAKAGKKNLYMRIIDPNGKVLPTKDGGGSKTFNDGATSYSVDRQIDYNNSAMDVCFFYSVPMVGDLIKGDYKVFVYEEENLIATTGLSLK